MTRCKDNITSTCGKKVNAKCVDYEGEYHDRTGFEECDKPSLEDVVEDINETLNFLSESVDLSQLPQACDAIDYSQDGDELLVSEALIAHSEMLCALIEHTGYGEPEPCPDCNDPCGNPSQSTCCESLIYISQLSTQLDIETSTGYPLLAGSVVLIPDGTISKISEVDLTIEEVGSYLVSADFVAEFGDGTLPLEGGVRALYELRLNGTVVPYSTRAVKIDSGTPANLVNSFSVVSEVTTTLVDSVLELWFSVDPSDTANSDLAITSCTLTAIKKR